MGRFFRNGTLEQEVVQTYGSPDMVVLAVIERAHVEVGGLPAQDWPLRVTLVYRREGDEWRLAHRHADPLVAGVSLEQAAALARERGSMTALPAAALGRTSLGMTTADRPRLGPPSGAPKVAESKRGIDAQTAQPYVTKP